MFALYVLGGKGIGAYRDRDIGVSNSFDHERKPPRRKGENPFQDEEEIN